MKNHLIMRQIEGLPLVEENNTHIEFQVRSGKAIVLSTNSRSMAEKHIEKRAESHGKLLAPMSLFRVTTITEKL